MILKEIVGERGDVITLLEPGNSPHTYEPDPSDAMQVEGATALFYVSENLDGWAASFDGPPKVKVLDFLPVEMRLQGIAHHDEAEAAEEHHHGETGYDPHFWTDPISVREVLPGIVDKLALFDPDGAEDYRNNSFNFTVSLDELDNAISEKMNPFFEAPVMLFHPSFQYFIHRYNLTFAGVIEPFPGREPSPAYLAELVDTIQTQHIKALFTEPQLPKAPAETIAQETGLPIFELDPNGGIEGRRTYDELMLYNADIYVQAFSL
jgi:zinc transport system substrate-binding protein